MISLMICCPFCSYTTTSNFTFDLHHVKYRFKNISQLNSSNTINRDIALYTVHYSSTPEK